MSRKSRVPAGKRQMQSGRQQGHLPRYSSNPIVRCRVRQFRLASAGNAATWAAITNKNIGDSQLVSITDVGTSTSLFNQRYANIRIRSVEIWGTGQAQNDTQEVGVAFVGSSGTITGPARRFVDTVMGSDGVAHVKATPPRGSLAADWVEVGTSTSQLINYVAPVGAVMEIVFDACEIAGGTGAANAANSGTAAVAIGNLFQRGFDGAPTSTSGWATVDFAQA